MNWGRVQPFTKLVSATQKNLLFSLNAFKLSTDFNCLDLMYSKTFLLSSRVWSWVRYSSFKEDQLRCECIGYRKSHGRFKIGSIKILQCIPCISIQILQDYPTGNSRTTESFSPFLCPME